MDTTLCYIERKGCYLMLCRDKKPNDISKGKYIGVGGKFLPGETPDECLLREVREETGFELTDFEYRGIVHFLNDCCEDEEMYLYTATGWNQPDSAEPFTETPIPQCNEGTFYWIPLEEVPLLPAWEGDALFLGALARGEKDIELTVVYHGDKLVDAYWGAKQNAEG